MASTISTSYLTLIFQGFQGTLYGMQLPKGIEFQWVSWPTGGWHHLPINQLSTKITKSTSKICSGKHLFSKKKTQNEPIIPVYPTNVDKRKLMEPHPHHDKDPWFRIGTPIASETLLTLHSFAASHGCTITDQEPPASVVKQLKLWPVLATFPDFLYKFVAIYILMISQDYENHFPKKGRQGQKSPCQRCKCSKNHPSYVVQTSIRRHFSKCNRYPVLNTKGKWYQKMEPCLVMTPGWVNCTSNFFRQNTWHKNYFICKYMIVHAYTVHLGCVPLATGRMPVTSKMFTSLGSRIPN